jgi:predicted amidohydrolase
MTAKRNFKRRVRARAAKTGESYTTALRHFRPTPSGDVMSETKSLRLAVAQTVVRQDPRATAELRESGREIRRSMRAAREAGARVVHFPEGATCFPDKRIMSSTGPDNVGPADWDRFDWATLREELAATTALAGKLKLWTVLGSVHRLTPPHRPHNSLYVISDNGSIATRYDERMLSNTKILHMYSPGSTPLAFEVDGVRFGLALGMEVHFPELFVEYEKLDVDCVLVSTTGPAVPVHNGAFSIQAQAHAASNSYWVSYSVAAASSPSGVINPDGQWVVRASEDETSEIVVVDLKDSENLARPWRRKARAGIYDPHLVRDDPRSEDRSIF